MGRFRGTVSIDTMLQALASGTATLESACLKDVAPVPQTLALNTLVGRIIKNPYPLAVVDAQQRYLGAVTQTILLKRMALEESSMSEALPLGEWVDLGVKFIVDNDGGTLERLGSGIGTLTEAIELGLQATPF